MLSPIIHQIDPFESVCFLPYYCCIHLRTDLCCVIIDLRPKRPLVILSSIFVCNVSKLTVSFIILHWVFVIDKNTKYWTQRAFNAVYNQPQPRRKSNSTEYNMNHSILCDINNCYHWIKKRYASFNTISRLCFSFLFEKPLNSLFFLFCLKIDWKLEWEKKDFWCTSNVWLNGIFVIDDGVVKRSHNSLW